MGNRVSSKVSEWFPGGHESLVDVCYDNKQFHEKIMLDVVLGAEAQATNQTDISDYITVIDARPYQACVDLCSLVVIHLKQNNMREQSNSPVEIKIPFLGTGPQSTTDYQENIEHVGTARLKNTANNKGYALLEPSEDPPGIFYEHNTNQPAIVNLKGEDLGKKHYSYAAQSLENVRCHFDTLYKCQGTSWERFYGSNIQPLMYEISKETFEDFIIGSYVTELDQFFSEHSLSQSSGLSQNFLKCGMPSSTATGSDRKEFNFKNLKGKATNISYELIFCVTRDVFWDTQSFCIRPRNNPAIHALLQEINNNGDDPSTNFSTFACSESKRFVGAVMNSIILHLGIKKDKTLLLYNMYQVAPFTSHLLSNETMEETYDFSVIDVFPKKFQKILFRDIQQIALVNTNLRSFSTTISKAFFTIFHSMQKFVSDSTNMPLDNAYLPLTFQLTPHYILEQQLYNSKQDSFVLPLTKKKDLNISTLVSSENRFRDALLIYLISLAHASFNLGLHNEWTIDILCDIYGMLLLPELKLSFTDMTRTIKQCDFQRSAVDPLLLMILLDQKRLQTYHQNCHLFDFFDDCLEKNHHGRVFGTSMTLFERVDFQKTNSIPESSFILLIISILQHLSYLMVCIHFKFFFFTIFTNKLVFHAVAVTQFLNCVKQPLRLYTKLTQLKSNQYDLRQDVDCEFMNNPNLDIFLQEESWQFSDKETIQNLHNNLRRFCFCLSNFALGLIDLKHVFDFPQTSLLLEIARFNQTWMNSNSNNATQFLKYFLKEGLENLDKKRMDNLQEYFHISCNVKKILNFIETSFKNVHIIAMKLNTSFIQKLLRTPNAKKELMCELNTYKLKNRTIIEPISPSEKDGTTATDALFSLLSIKPLRLCQMSFNFMNFVELAETNYQVNQEYYNESERTIKNTHTEQLNSNDVQYISEADVIEWFKAYCWYISTTGFQWIRGSRLHNSDTVCTAILQEGQVYLDSSCIAEMLQEEISRSSSTHGIRQIKVLESCPLAIIPSVLLNQDNTAELQLFMQYMKGQIAV